MTGPCGETGTEAPDGRTVYHARSGLASFDSACFYGAPPVHGPPKRSDFGYAAMFQARLRATPEAEARGTDDLVLLMVTSAHHEMEVWLDGQFRGKVPFRRGDLVAIPPGMDSRWCAPDGQASALHLHISGQRLAQTLVEEKGCTRLNLVPGLAFRDPALQRLMQAAARLDDADPLVKLQVAAIGAQAMLRVLRVPPPGLSTALG